MDRDGQRRLVKQAYELIERLELARHKIYAGEEAQSGSTSTSSSTVRALKHAERLRTALDRARRRHARRMRVARALALP